MRDPERIDKFCKDLAIIWKKNCPDWRFGQLIINVLGGTDPFYLEEPQMIEKFREYFE